MPRSFWRRISRTSFPCCYIRNETSDWISLPLQSWKVSSSTIVDESSLQSLNKVLLCLFWTLRMKMSTLSRSFIIMNVYSSILIQLKLRIKAFLSADVNFIYAFMKYANRFCDMAADKLKPMARRITDFFIYLTKFLSLNSWTILFQKFMRCGAENGNSNTFNPAKPI